MDEKHEIRDLVANAYQQAGSLFYEKPQGLRSLFADIGTELRSSDPHGYNALIEAVKQAGFLEALKKGKQSRLSDEKIVEKGVAALKPLKLGNDFAYQLTSEIANGLGLISSFPSPDSKKGRASTPKPNKADKQIEGPKSDAPAQDDGIPTINKTFAEAINGVKKGPTVISNKPKSKAAAPAKKKVGPQYSYYVFCNKVLHALLMVVMLAAYGFYGYILINTYLLNMPFEGIWNFTNIASISLYGIAAISGIASLVCLFISGSLHQKLLYTSLIAFLLSLVASAFTGFMTYNALALWVSAIAFVLVAIGLLFIILKKHSLGKWLAFAGMVILFIGGLAMIFIPMYREAGAISEEVYTLFFLPEGLYPQLSSGAHDSIISGLLSLIAIFSAIQIATFRAYKS